VSPAAAVLRYNETAGDPRPRSRKRVLSFDVIDARRESRLRRLKEKSQSRIARPPSRKSLLPIYRIRGPGPLLIRFSRLFSLDFTPGFHFKQLTAS